MIELTEHEPGYQAGNASGHREDEKEVFERLTRLLGQYGQARSDRSPRATVQLDRARKALLLRSVEAIAREIYQFDAVELKELSSKSDPNLLVELAQAVLTDSPLDRTQRMALKGAERFRKLLDKFGGSVSTQWVSEFLDTSEAAVRKRAQRKSLIARRMPNGELSFPRFQFDEAAGDLVKGMHAFLVHVNKWPVEEIVHFLLVPHTPSHTRDTPLDMLKRDELRQVIDLANMHLTQRP